MKRRILLISFCLCVLSGLNGNAQHLINRLEDSGTSVNFFSSTLTADTASIPKILENPLFYNYNFTYKKRLDSIQSVIPLNYNEAVQRYIDVYANRVDMMGKMLGLSEYYFPIFENALKSFDLPLELKYLPIIESSMNSHAISRVGATGLWQFMFTTAKGYGLKMDNFVDERKDPIEASYAAAKYFKDAYASLGDWLLAIAAYNCGTGNVNRAIAKANSRDFWEIRPYLPAETRNYVPALIAAIYVMNHPESHQIKSQKSLFAGRTDTIHVNRFVSLSDLAQAMSIEEEELYTLNPSYKKKIVNGSVEEPKRIIMPDVNLATYANVYNVLNNRTVDVKMQVIQASNDDKRLQKKGVNQPSEAKATFHKVLSGQNLSTIANKYNVEVQDLVVWNKLKGHHIVPGQKLIVSRNSNASKSTRPSDSGRRYISYKEKKSVSGKSGGRF